MNITLKEVQFLLLEITQKIAKDLKKKRKKVQSTCMHSQHTHHLTLGDFIITLILLFEEGEADAIFPREAAFTAEFQARLRESAIVTTLMLFSVYTHLSVEFTLIDNPFFFFIAITDVLPFSFLFSPPTISVVSSGADGSFI